MEREAERLYGEVGLSLDEVGSPAILARRLLGPAALRIAHASSFSGDAALVRVGSEWRIYLRSRLPVHRERFVIAHELAHWALGAEATEDECDALAAALVAPRRAFLRLLVVHGEKYADLARETGSTESYAALRSGEVMGEPVALITPSRIRVRGPDWGWPPEPELRRVAGTGGPGLRRVELRDAPRSVVLRAN